MESKLTRKDLADRRNKILYSVEWLNTQKFPIYMRNSLINSLIKYAGLQNNYLYTILNWVLKSNCCETQIRSLVETVDNIIEKKKNSDIKNIFVAHNLWFSHNPGLSLPLMAIPYENAFDIELNDIDELSELQMSGIENFAAISSI